MNELIKVKEEKGQQLVSARELHEYLGVTERFQQWFDKKISKYEFVGGVDYVGCKIFHTLARQEIQDYSITIEMAKELSMVQDNERGKQARRYFIECEKQLKNSQTIATDKINLLMELAKSTTDEKLKNNALRTVYNIIVPIEEHSVCYYSDGIREYE